MTEKSFNLLSFTGKMKTLHMTWFAFFLTFVVWFNIAPFRDEISSTFGLTGPQFKSLLILNVSMAIPARIIIGMMTDKFGPRKVYSALLFIASIPCFFFAFAQDYQQLAIARFAVLLSVSAWCQNGSRIMSLERLKAFMAAGAISALRRLRLRFQRLLLCLAVRTGGAMRLL